MTWPVPKNSLRSLGAMAMTARMVQMPEEMAVNSHRVWKNWVEVYPPTLSRLAARLAATTARPANRITLYTASKEANKGRCLGSLVRQLWALLVTTHWQV